MITVKRISLIPEILARTAPAMEAAKEETLKAIYDDSQGRVPVDTGTLKGSGEISHLAGEVSYGGEEADYAIFVEYGTRFDAAQPFLSPAAQHAEGKTIEEFGLLLFGRLGSV